MLHLISFSESIQVILGVLIIQFSRFFKIRHGLFFVTGQQLDSASDVVIQPVAGIHLDGLAN